LLPLAGIAFPDACREGLPMLRHGWMLLLCLLGPPAWCEEDIVDVLQRSQELRLQAMPPAPADSERAATVRRSFDVLLQALHPAPRVELRVIRGPVVAETLHGQVIVANERLAEVPEPVRLFILAHELGHVAQQHWLQTTRLYRKWVPGPVTRDRTDPVAGQLAREASALAYRQEFAADAFAARALQALGHGDDDLSAVFREFGMTQDTATHPASGKRIAMLRALHPAPADSLALAPH
jgi:Zn-dependent protease with chaperone function